MNRLLPSTGRASFVLALLTLGAAGCNFSGQPNPAERPVPPDRVVAFDALYGQNCAGCHGANGKMGPAPPLNDPLFRAIVPEKTVEEVVAGGRRGTLMPAFSREQGGPLTPTQVAVLVNEIKGIPYRVIEKEKDGGPSAFEVVRDSAGTAPAWGSPGPRRRARRRTSRPGTRPETPAPAATGSSPRAPPATATTARAPRKRADPPLPSTIRIS